MRALILIPTYNERENIAAITAAVLARALSSHVLIIDDGSPDGTGDVADALAAKDERIRVLHRSGKLGLGTAYVAGFRRALEGGYDAAITFDADFSHPPESLPEMMRLLERYDFVAGSRYVKGGRPEGWPLRRYILSRWANYYAKFVGGMPVRDCTGGYNGIRRGVLQSYPLDRFKARGYVFHHEIKFRAHRAGFSMTEFPIVFRDRAAGKSKMSMRIIVEAFFHVLRLRLGLA